MFLVELSYNTVKEEIVDLELKRNAKREALSDSSNQLEKDNKKLVDFIEKDNLDTENINKEADNAAQERKNKELQIRTIDTNIQNVKSEIDKNVDQLNALEKHKSFLFGIFEKENPQWVGMLKQERERKLETIRRKWLE
jgi:chromosome segregation ATPase